jgi:hypothetical protein
VKLNNRKIQWLIQEKLRGRGTGELALIQKVTRRRVEQLWQTYKSTGLTPTLKQPGRPRKPRNLKDANLILQAYDKHQTNALTLQKIISQEQHIHQPHNRNHEVLRMTSRAEPQPAKKIKKYCSFLSLPEFITLVTGNTKLKITDIKPTYYHFRSYGRPPRITSMVRSLIVVRFAPEILFALDCVYSRGLSIEESDAVYMKLQKDEALAGTADKASTFP